MKSVVSAKLLLLMAVACSLAATASFVKIGDDSLVGYSDRLTEGAYRTSLADSMVDYGKTFIGRKYASMGPSLWRLDCSGFVAEIYSKFGMRISHSSPGIAQKINKIGLDEVRKGDLLFFKGRNLHSAAVGHVAMVAENDAEGIRMLHSCSRGVLIEKYPDQSYYEPRFLFAGRILDGDPIEDAIEAQDTAEKVAKAETITITGVGDIMLGTNYPSTSYLPPDDGKKLLAPVITYLAAADVTFGNMEGTILSGQGIPKQCKDPSLCYVFKSPDHYVDYFKEAGFDLLSVANNHSGDFGKPGKDNTVRLLNDRGIAFAGFSDHPTAIIEKNGLKIGLCAFAPNSGTVNINDHKTAKEIVRNLAKSCDIVIVSFHGGAEGAGHTHITRKTETFYGENRGNPYLFAREVIDAGADVVLGHGPHVTRAFDVYQGRFIAYSMGNFATYGRFNLKGSAGLAPIVNIKINSDGSFIEGRVISTEQKGEGGPLIDPDGKVLKEIINLTKTDIPEVPLIFSDDGTFRMK